MCIRPICPRSQWTGSGGDDGPTLHERFSRKPIYPSTIRNLSGPWWSGQSRPNSRPELGVSSLGPSCSVPWVSGSRTPSRSHLIVMSLILGNCSPSKCRHSVHPWLQVLCDLGSSFTLDWETDKSGTESYPRPVVQYTPGHRTCPSLLREFRVFEFSSRVRKNRRLKERKEMETDKSLRWTPKTTTTTTKRVSMCDRGRNRGKKGRKVEDEDLIERRWERKVLIKVITEKTGNR